MDQVLLIEGHRLLRETLKELLAQNSGCSVAEVADPLEAIGHILRHPPQIIILDTVWAEVNGFWLGKMLRQLAPQCKIVLLVDDSWLAETQRVPSDGVDAFVPKNRLMKTLLPVLAQWLPLDEVKDLKKGDHAS